MSNREFHATKKGPGRRHKDGTHRGEKEKGSYVQGLLNHFAKKAREAMPKFKARDKHGAFTLTGARVWNRGGMIVRKRRIWLAGISSQRGY